MSRASRVEITVGWGVRGGGVGVALTSEENDWEMKAALGSEGQKDMLGCSESMKTKHLRSIIVQIVCHSGPPSRHQGRHKYSLSRVRILVFKKMLW